MGADEAEVVDVGVEVGEADEDVVEEAARTRNESLTGRSYGTNDNTREIPAPLSNFNFLFFFLLN